MVSDIPWCSLVVPGRLQAVPCVLRWSNVFHSGPMCSLVVPSGLGVPYVPRWSLLCQQSPVVSGGLLCSPVVSRDPGLPLTSHPTQRSTTGVTSILLTRGNRFPVVTRKLAGPGNRSPVLFGGRYQVTPTQRPVTSGPRADRPRRDTHQYRPIYTAELSGMHC